MSDRVNVLCMKCGGDILAPPALCGNCASAIPPREPTEDQRDAARYRWLRDEGDETWTALGRRWPQQDAVKLDAAIDAAMAEKEGK